MARGLALPAKVRTNDFGPCAKREVFTSQLLPLVMRAGWHRRGGPRRRTVGLALGLAVLTAVSLPGLGAAHSGRANGPPWATTFMTDSGGYGLSNGWVDLSFPTTGPSFTLTSVTNQSLTVLQSLTGLAEVTNTDKIVSFARFDAPNTTWSTTLGAEAGATSLVLAADVPVVASTGDWESGDGGNESRPAVPVDAPLVSVAITFRLNDSQGLSPSTVSYSLNVTGWPWVNATTDAVGLQVRSNLTLGVGYWQPAGNYSLMGVAVGTRTPLASFAWGASASAQYPVGSPQEGGVGAYRNLSADNSSSLVRLEFISVQGGYSALAYDPWLEVFAPPAKLASALEAWVVTPTALAALGAGGALAVLFAGLARSRRVPPEHGL